MKANGFILTYPLGYTNIGDSNQESKVSDIENTLNTLREQLKKLDQDGNPDTENEFDTDIDNFIDILNDRLKMKADLRDDTDDGINNPTVVPEQLPNQDMMWEE